MKLVSRLALVLVIVWTTLLSYAMAAEGDVPEPPIPGPGGALIGQPAGYGTNLLTNGDFSDALSDTNWRAWPASEKDVLERVKAPTDDGNDVFKIAANEIPGAWNIAGIDRYIDIRSGEFYTLSADAFVGSIKTRDQGSDEPFYTSLLTMKILFYNGDQMLDYNFADINYPTAGFETTAISGKIPDGTTYAKIELYVKAREAGASAVVYLDNIHLQYDWMPRNLRYDVDSRTSTSIDLLWDAPTDEASVAEYEVFKNGESIGKTVEKTFKATGLTPSKIDAFTVKAISKDGYVSGASNMIKAAPRKADGKTTIMPLGDSITLGKPIPGGYRDPLWANLAKIVPPVEFDFVGSLQTYSSPTLPDSDHEGLDGKRAHEIAEYIDNEVALYEPDIILLHAGSNDMFIDFASESDTAIKAADGLEMILAKINDNTRLDNSHVIVATIPGIYTDEAKYLPRVEAYNARVKELVETYKNTMSIEYVEMGAMIAKKYFTPETDLIHPSAEGYKMMADVWYDAIDAHVKQISKNPATPGVTASLNTNLTATIAWTESADNIGVDHYEIKQGSETIATIPSSGMKEYTTGVLQGSMTAETTYTFGVIAVDHAGNRSTEGTTTVVVPKQVDPTIPPSVTNVVYDPNGLSYNSVVLLWDPVLGGDLQITGYNVYQGDTKIGTVTDASPSVDPNRMSFTVVGLLPEQTYTFKVETVTAAGKVSEVNPTVTVTTEAAPPSGLEVLDQTDGSVLLKWNAASDSDGVKEYRLYLDGIQVDKVGADVLTYSFNGLVHGQTYSFQVAAVDNHDNETDRSEAKSYRHILAAPSGLAQSAEPTDSTISVKWNRVPGAVKYHVYVDGSLRGTTENTSYTANNLAPETAYKFSVIAESASEIKSERSLELSITTKKRPEPQTNSGGGGGGGFFFIPSLDDKAEYSGEKDAVKLLFTPNEQKSLNTLNGSDASLVINVPSDKPFNTVELALSGEVLKLAADKKKTIMIRSGGVSVELPAGWIETQKGDKVLLSVQLLDVSGDEIAKQQGLESRSAGYDFALTVNGKAVDGFKQPVQLTITPNDKTESSKAGIYLFDEAAKKWTLVGGAVDKDGKVSAELEHFSKYAVFASMKTFSDIEGHWAKADIEALAAKQIVSGVSEELFNPSGEVTRAEFAAMLARALDLKASANKLPFADVQEDAWYYEDIKAAYEAGLIKGINDDQFAPNERINREQMAVMIVKAYDYAKETSFDDVHGTVEGYADGAQISAWAKVYVEAASMYELIFGIDGSFKPQDLADRAQAAALVNRLLKKL